MQRLYSFFLSTNTLKGLVLLKKIFAWFLFWLPLLIGRMSWAAGALLNFFRKTLSCFLIFWIYFLLPLFIGRMPWAAGAMLEKTKKTLSCFLSFLIFEIFLSQQFFGWTSTVYWQNAMSSGSPAQFLIFVRNTYMNFVWNFDLDFA